MSVNAATRAADQDRLYDLLDAVTAGPAGLRELGDPMAGAGCPGEGVYFFFEPGELRLDGRYRVVRVGTHGLTSTSKATLWGRLRQHRGTLAGRSPGGGNHRGSIFRRHLGAALIHRDQLPAPSIDAWLAPDREPAWAVAEAELERRVSAYIRRMPFTWVAVTDVAAGPRLRGAIERTSIALLSAATGETDPAGRDWLGCWAVAPEIGRSGLWNVNHIGDTYDPSVLDLMEHLAEAQR